MPRTKEREPAPAAPPSLVASAARIRGGSTPMGLYTSQSKGAQAWHEEAWEHYHELGELRYACDWIGGMLSKAEIHGTQEDANGVITKVTTGPIPGYLSDLFNNADGRAEMFRLVGIHLSVTGECNLVGYPDPDPFGNGGDKWEVAASTKVTRPSTEGEPWKVNDVTLSDVDPDDVMCIRLWRPDPLEPQYSISPVRSILRDLRQLRKLSDFVSAQLDSRLAGAGILLMPDTMTTSIPPSADGNEARVKHANSADELVSTLIKSMEVSLRNQATAEAKVPIVVTASAESIAAVQHMTFWSELDQHAIELRKEAIGRLALGMDVPPEVLQGSSDSNHWSAWQADESAIKAHAEPLLKIITTALGSHYLRPLLHDDESFDEQNLSDYSIVADTSEMRLRPNRGKEAIELYNLGELSGETLRRETGFDETDAMEKEELALWLTRKVAMGSTTPDLVEAALKELGVTLTVVRETDDVSRETQEGRPAPSLKDHPSMEIPDQQRSADRKEARQEGRVPSSDIERTSSLMAACDQIVLRALERAGNRIKSKTNSRFSVPAAELHCFVLTENVDDVLVDAWSHVPMVAKRAGLDAAALSAELQEYTAGLILSQTPHTYEGLTAFMTRNVEVAAA